jgi:hypothetical protein
MGKCTLIPDNSELEATLEECCLIHDRDYMEQVLTRAEADVHFYKCALTKIDPVMSIALFVGISLGGWFFWYRRIIKRLLARSPVCEKYRIDYKTFCLTKKIKGDFLFSYGVLMQSWKYFPLAFVSLVFLLTFGTVYWLWKRTLDAIKGGL